MKESGVDKGRLEITLDQRECRGLDAHRNYSFQHAPGAEALPAPGALWGVSQGLKGDPDWQSGQEPLGQPSRRRLRPEWSGDAGGEDGPKHGATAAEAGGRKVRVR